MVLEKIYGILKIMKKKNEIALIYRVLCFILIFAGIASQVRLFSGNVSLGIFMYYTIQSNILAFVLFGMLIWKSIIDIKDNKKLTKCSYYERFSMIVSIDIFLTLFVFWVLLAPGAFTMTGDANYLTSFDNLMVHLITPIFCFIDYILFQDKGKLKYKDTLYVVVYPLCYVAFTSICGFLGYVYGTDVSGRASHVPYFFYDWEVLGLFSFVYIFALLAFFIALSNGFYFLDKKVASKRKLQ